MARRCSSMQGAGYCECGCGETTTVYRGVPRRYVNGHTGRKTLRYRIEDRGYLTPCWVWQLHISNAGYGTEGVGCRLAHRVSYETHVGPIPEGMVLDHLCCIRECVNPDHLEPVTQAENVRRSRTAKLRREDVDEIKRLVAAGVSQRETARLLGVSHALVWQIQHGKSWAAM